MKSLRVKSESSNALCNRCDGVMREAFGCRGRGWGGVLYPRLNDTAFEHVTHAR